MKLTAGTRPHSCVPEAACPRAAGKNVSLFTRAPWISTRQEMSRARGPDLESLCSGKFPSSWTGK